MTYSKDNPHVVVAYYNGSIIFVASFPDLSHASTFSTVCSRMADFKFEVKPLLTQTDASVWMLHQVSELFKRHAEIRGCEIVKLGNNND